MTNRICIPALLLAAGLFAQSDNKPAKDASVWAIDDTDKIHPITGNLLSEGRDIYNGTAPSKGEYRTHNSSWDAGTGTVKLVAGRNEFVSFQIVLEKHRDDLHKVFVNATDLFGSKERISADSNVRMFKQLYVSLRGAWYPDALLPFDIAGATPFDLPDADR